jgi:serine/threonine-protein kinase
MYAPGALLLGRYQVEAQLGVGGCGLVLRARDHVLGQTVAIKILRTDVGFARDMETRFMREARAIAHLTSEHVVRIFDVGTLETGAPFMAMELLHGADLSEMLVRRRVLAPAIAVDFILQACEALAEVHALGIVHRDIKPSNLFVTALPDGSEVVKVLDFGISKSPMLEGDLSLTQTASLLGTPSYMSPEQMRSARLADARSDLWALGTVLYELVEGHLPISADSFAELVVATTTQPHQPLIAAPQLAPVIARCLAKNPDQRYANVAELARDLARFTNRPIGLACAARTMRVLGVGHPGHVAMGTRSSSAALPGRRSRLRLAIAGAAIAAIAITVAVFAARGADREQPVHVQWRPAVAAPAAPAAPMLHTDATPASSPADAGVSAAAPPRATAEPPPPVHAGPPSSPPAKPLVRRKPSAPGSRSGCDPYASPRGC